jgi:hypothetical protein
MLFGEKRDVTDETNRLLRVELLIEETLERLSTDEMLLEYLVHVCGFHALVKSPLGMYDHDGPSRAKSIAPTLNNVNFFVKPAIFRSLCDLLVQLDTASCVATRTTTDEKSNSLVAIYVETSIDPGF